MAQKGKVLSFKNGRGFVEVDGEKKAVKSHQELKKGDRVTVFQNAAFK